VGDERGSVLLLLPAAVLIFLVLGALCVDYGSVYVAQRELSDAAAAAANDAATRALDLSSLYGGGEVHLVPGLAEEVARQSLAAKGLDRLEASVEGIEVTGTTVTVRVRGRAHFLFAKAVPGGSDGMDLVTAATAEAAESP
jgi:Flp pilus assembly protein TadG